MQKKKRDWGPGGSLPRVTSRKTGFTQKRSIELEGNREIM